jgi:hypothetical protein
MGVSSGGGVSIGGGGDSVDLQALISGGAGFTERLKLFDEAATRAADNAARAEQLLAQAKAAQARADEAQQRADASLAECVAKAAALDQAIADAKQARANLDGRLQPLLKFLRA